MLLCQAPRQKDCGSVRVLEGVITTLEERNIRTRDGGGGTCLDRLRYTEAGENRTVA